MVISDAHEGLKAAARTVLGAGWQRCRVHFMRNLLARVGKTHNREAVIPLVGALMLEQNDEWAVSRRYMPARKLTGVCDHPEAAVMIAAK